MLYQTLFQLAWHTQQGSTDPWIRNSETDTVSVGSVGSDGYQRIRYPSTDPSHGYGSNGYGYFKNLPHGSVDGYGIRWIRRIQRIPYPSPDPSHGYGSNGYGYIKNLSHGSVDGYRIRWIRRIQRIPYPSTDPSHGYGSNGYGYFKNLSHGSVDRYYRICWIRQIQRIPLLPYPSKC